MAQINQPALRSDGAQDLYAPLLAGKTPPLRPASALQFQMALDHMKQGVCMYGPDWRVILCNKPFAEIYGLPLEAVRPGTCAKDILLSRIENGIYGEGGPEAYLRERLASIETQIDQIQKLSDGRSILIRQRPMANGGWVTTHEDVTERCRAEAQLQHVAHHDALTKLPNRVLLKVRLNEAFKRVLRGETIALLWIDLDCFKNINDTYGHAIGDLLLERVAARLAATVRETDTVARLGGDEFAVLQVPAPKPLDAISLAERLLAAVSQPYEIAGHIMQVGCSIGIALADQKSCEVDALMGSADFALYRAKAAGRGSIRFFEPSMNADMTARRNIERDLRRAIVKGQFELYYQPIVNLERRAVTGFEALIRWRHPTRGMVPPIDFIPIAEETGLIIPLGEWVVNQACKDACTWPEHISVAVNLSAAQFKHQAFVASIEMALADSGLAPQRLELEITESLMMSDAKKTLDMLSQLKKLGVRISMDDFGTGYSSLNSLSSFPFDKLKIDRSFIKDLPDAGKSLAILRSIANLGGSLGMTTTAEGVETSEQLDIVTAEGCVEVQGYFFSPPRPASEVLGLIASCASK